MKILYVINHMDWFWSHRLSLAKAAQNEGWSVGVAAPGAAQDTQLSTYFIGHDLPDSNLFYAIRITRKILRHERPTIVHAITLKCAFTTGLAALGLKDIRIMHTLAGLGYLFSGEGLKPKILRALIGPFLKLALKNATLVFQNPDDQALMIARGFTLPTQCHLIRGSGVDTEQFPFAEEPETDEPIILMPTRLVHEKGVAVFIEAAKILQQRGINAKFLIAGGLSASNPNAITEAEMETLLAGSPVEWLGKVSNMPALLAKSTIVVYPSYYGEGVPKVLLEAMSTGRAIITTDHPGCREAVRHNENGLLVPVKDAMATADAIEHLLKDTDQRHKMGANGRQRAEQEFNVHLINQKTLAIYSA